MKVKLLYHTPDPEHAIAVAGRICYSKVGASEVNENMSGELEDKLLNIFLDSGHSSTLEHASFTFAVEGISRSATHQLVRHRLASYNQQSQRYVNFDDGFDFTTPKSISDNEEATKIYNECIEKIAESYTKLRELDITPEDARYLLPNACHSNIVITMNARELLHFFSLRTCRRAQDEIQELAWLMLKEIRKVAPRVFAAAGPDCVRGDCSEGSMTCGKPYPKVKKK